jgi:imidazolonepropionase-like amidohydrolase
MRTSFLFIFFCLLIQSAVANDQIPAPPQTKPIVLMNGTVHTVSGADISGGNVLFEDGKITAVGKNITLPDDVIKIDIEGKHVYPGLIALNTNLGLSEIEAVRATRDKNETGEINPNVRAEAAFNPDSELIPVARANGIAVVQSMPVGGLVSGLSALMMMDGWTWEDMTLKAPLGLHIYWPSMNFNRENGSSKERRDERIQQIKDTIAEARAYWKAREANPNAHNSDSRWEAMKPVLDGEANVMIHADDIREIQASITWVLDEGLKPILVGGRDSWRITEWLKERDIPVIVYSADTLSFRDWEPFDTGFTLPKKLFEAGVKFAYSFPQYGNSGDNAILRNLPYHVAKAVSYGLPKDEGLKSITLYPAQIMGVADRVGSIETGKDATLIITDGDPLEIRTHVEKMYIQGRDVDLTSRHTMLYEKYKTKYEQQNP